MTLENQKAIGKLLINYKELILCLRMENLLRDDVELIEKILT